MPGYLDPRQQPQGIGLPDFGPSVVEQMQANSQRVRDVARTQGWGAAMRDPVSGRMGQDIAGQFDFTGPAGIGLGTIRAYHGSPHTFDKFSMEHIGKGEGAQAYGHGLYFAENPAVAHEYQKNLTNPAGHSLDLPTGSTPRSELDDAGRSAFWHASQSGSIKDAIAELKDAVAASPASDSTRRQWEQDLKTLQGWDKQGAQINLGGGKYTVDLDVNHEDLLDWDKPLGEQSPKVLEALKKVGWDKLAQHAVDKGWTSGTDPAAETIGDLYGHARYMLEPDPAKYTLESWDATKAKVAQQLREAGIPGIRYLDAGSRGGEGTRNITMFDDALIKILERNGIGLGGK